MRSEISLAWKARLLLVLSTQHRRRWRKELFKKLKLETRQFHFWREKRRSSQKWTQKHRWKLEKKQTKMFLKLSIVRSSLSLHNVYSLLLSFFFRWQISTSTLHFRCSATIREKCDRVFHPDKRFPLSFILCLLVRKEINFCFMSLSASIVSKQGKVHGRYTNVFVHVPIPIWSTFLWDSNFSQRDRKSDDESGKLIEIIFHTFHLSRLSSEWDDEFIDVLENLFIVSSTREKNTKNFYQVENVIRDCDKLTSLH